MTDRLSGAGSSGHVQSLNRVESNPDANEDAHLAGMGFSAANNQRPPGPADRDLLESATSANTQSKVNGVSQKKMEENLAFIDKMTKGDTPIPEDVKNRMALSPTMMKHLETLDKAGFALQVGEGKGTPLDFSNPGTILLDLKQMEEDPDAFLASLAENLVALRSTDKSDDALGEVALKNDLAKMKGELNQASDYLKREAEVSEDVDGGDAAPGEEPATRTERTGPLVETTEASVGDDEGEGSAVRETEVNLDPARLSPDELRMLRDSRPIDEII